jgi:hypothetical protein
MKSEKNRDNYSGFEQGPIRPPSEADSLLIRVTRNCPWNHCTFCPVYKGAPFSIRPVSHVKQDIDTVCRFIDRLEKLADPGGRIARMDIQKLFENIDPSDSQALQAALSWYAAGMRSIFIQDANSLIIKPERLIDILTHIKNRFPRVDRITSYARSHTIAKISDGDLSAMGSAGLNRIHIGLESGSDQVLKMIKKGVTKEIQIKAGIKVKRAGIELSEYVMPGLGGQGLSEDHALETADALNRINPDFIRLRTLAIPNRVPLFDDFSKGLFKKCTDRMTVKEIMRFLESLNGIESMIKSDHILNLFQEVEGKLPEERDRILAPLRAFARLDPDRQCLYQVGRRLGIFSRLSDMDSPHRIAKVEKTCRQHGITPENVDDTVDELMKRFI